MRMNNLCLHIYYQQKVTVHCKTDFSIDLQRDVHVVCNLRTRTITTVHY